MPRAPAGQDDHELVAAGAVDAAVGADDFAEAVADLPDLHVAGRMAVAVVDLLQAVEVDRQQRERLRGLDLLAIVAPRSSSNARRFPSRVSVSVRACAASCSTRRWCVRSTRRRWRRTTQKRRSGPSIAASAAAPISMSTRMPFARPILDGRDTLGVERLVAVDATAVNAAFAFLRVRRRVGKEDVGAVPAAEPLHRAALAPAVVGCA